MRSIPSFKWLLNDFHFLLEIVTHNSVSVFLFSSISPNWFDIMVIEANTKEKKPFQIDWSNVTLKQSISMNHKHSQFAGSIWIKTVAMNWQCFNVQTDAYQRCIWIILNVDVFFVLLLIPFANRTKMQGRNHMDYKQMEWELQKHQFSEEKKQEQDSKRDTSKHDNTMCWLPLEDMQRQPKTIEKEKKSKSNWNQTKPNQQIKYYLSNFDRFTSGSFISSAAHLHTQRFFP